ncbi:MAG: dTDP-4-dehydrorhamnose reductase [Candidatus Odinarchaeota archaeon]
MEKLLIIGASGLTGYRLAKLSSEFYEVYGTYNKRPINIENCEISQLDKTNKEKVHSLIKHINPNIVIDCSAVHNVDYCETHQEETWNVNVEATKFIAKICKDIEARMIYISTDYIFDGTAKHYDEYSKPNPINYYGVSKLKAEEEIANLEISYAIARTSLIFGWIPSELKGLESSSKKSINFVLWALNKLRNRVPLNIVTDQFSTPTFVDNLVNYLLALAKSNENGIFHTTGKQCLNRYEFACKIIEVFNINKDLITPVTSDLFEQIAERPMRCCLSSDKAQKLLGVKPYTIQEALLKMKEQEDGLI